MRGQRGTERQAMGHKYLVVRPVLPQVGPELVDLATQFLMCLRQLQRKQEKEETHESSTGERLENTGRLYGDEIRSM